MSRIWKLFVIAVFTLVIVSPVLAEPPGAQLGPMPKAPAPGKGGGMPDCPMMGGGMPMMDMMGGKADARMMQMHGEMMKAMGDIMMKYGKAMEPTH